MTKNMTMAIDADLLKKARKIAVDKNTTVTGLIRNYLLNLTEQEAKNKNQIISELANLFDHSKAVVGEKAWNREALHER
jgi:serine/threonine protein kinase HipA of HipAB toxin-antitoxin module